MKASSRRSSSDSAPYENRSHGDASVHYNMLMLVRGHLCQRFLTIGNVHVVNSGLLSQIKKCL